MARLDIGETAEVGFVFQDQNGVLTTPTSVSILPRQPNGVVLTPALTEADPEVTLGATLGAVLAADLGLSPAQNAAGVGIVRLLYPVTISGRWRFQATGDFGGGIIEVVTEPVWVRPSFSVVEGTIEGNCQDPAEEIPDCEATCVDVELNDRVYRTAWATLVAAGESLTLAGLDQPCERWIEVGPQLSISPVGDCGCEALVVAYSSRQTSGEACAPDRILRLDVVISHVSPGAIDAQGQPTRMPTVGDEAGNNCASMNGLALRMSREVEALDRLLVDRLTCRLDRCRNVRTVNETWIGDGRCRRYTRTIEIHQ